MENYFQPEIECASREQIRQWQDERLTTVMAERVLLEANMDRFERKKVVDKQAAVLILQSYLDTH